MGEEHLDLLPEFHRDVILASLGNVACSLAGIFLFFAGDLAGVGVRAAFGLRGARLADFLQGAVSRCAFACGFSVRVGIVAAELLQGVTLGADVLIVLSIPFEVGAGRVSIGIRKSPAVIAQFGPPCGREGQVGKSRRRASPIFSTQINPAGRYVVA